MQDALNPTPSSTTSTTTTVTTTTTPLLTRGQLIEWLDAYMAGKQDAKKLLTINPEALHDLILREHQDETLLFHPIFKGVNLPGKDQDEKEGKKRPNDDTRRTHALKILCDKLTEYPSGNLMLKILLQKQSNSGAKTVLHVAAQGQRSEKVINYLLWLANSLSIQNYVNILDDSDVGLGATPLYFATDGLQIENMQALLQQGANPLAKTREGISIYQILVEKVNDQRATTGAKLLQQSSPEIKKNLNPYMRFSPIKTPPSSPPPPDQKITASSEDNALQKIINVKLLLDFVKTKETSLSSFIGFLQGLSILFAGDKSEDTALRQQFLKDFDEMQSQFLEAATKGILNADKEEQNEALAVAAWLMNQKRYTAALSLFQRLLSDEYSIFLQNTSQIYKMLRWSAICIGKIYVEQKYCTLLKTDFLDPIHDVDNLKDLREALEAVAANKKLPPAFQQDIAQLLSRFHRGQAHLSPVLDSVAPDIKHILATSSTQTKTSTTATTTTTTSFSSISTSPSSSSTIGVLESQIGSSQMLTTSFSPPPLTAPGRIGHFGSSTSGSATAIISTATYTNEQTPNTSSSDTSSSTTNMTR